MAYLGSHDLTEKGPPESGRGRRWLVHHLAQWLLVLDVPATAAARVRQLSRGGRRKNDRIDAAAAACVAALQGDARSVEGPTDVLALLDERRTTMCNS